ncbi:hypothetical protein [Dactylosporangium maewongense]
MRSIPRRLGVSLGALAVAAGLVVTAGAGPASAAGERKSMCSAYTNFTIWQTSNEWARVSERTCVDWINYGNQVRARGEFRIDWPVDCSVSLPPGASCPLSRLTKAKNLALHELQVSIGWNLAGRVSQGTCTWKKQYRAPSVLTTTAPTFNCQSNWYSHPRGTYTAWTSAMGDVMSDGDGWRTLPRDQHGVSFG